MSTRYLGPVFDVHGGGLDLVFPHHENEQAQSRAAGDGFARWWFHNGLLTLAGEKMSKSLGNSLLVLELLRRWRRGRAALLPDLRALPVLFGLLRGGAGRGRGGVPAGGGLPDPGGRAGRRRPARWPAGGVRRGDGRRPGGAAGAGGRARRGPGGQRGPGGGGQGTGDGAVRRGPGDARACSASTRCPTPWRDERRADLAGVVDALVAVALDQRRGGPAAAATTPRPTPSAPGSPPPASPSRTPPAVHGGPSRILRERAPPHRVRTSRPGGADVTVFSRGDLRPRHGVRAAAGSAGPGRR